MWSNPQETADLVTFTEEICSGKLHFSAVFVDDGGFATAFFVFFLLFKLFFNMWPRLKGHAYLNKPEGVSMYDLSVDTRH